MLNYAQLDFTDNKIKKANIIGGEEVGIIPSLVEQYPGDFVNLEGRENIPLDTSDWYYNTETDTFIQTKDLPKPEPATPEPYQPTNAEIAQMVSDLYAEIIIGRA